MSSLTALDSPRSSSGPLIGVIPLRVGAGLILLYLHVWADARLAYDALWNGKPWAVIDLVAKSGLPIPKILAVAAAIITASVAVAWVLGFMTRFFSLIFIPVTLGALLVCRRNGLPGGGEAALVFLLISLTLVIFGSGWLSLDSLFGRRRQKKKPSRYV